MVVFPLLHVLHMVGVGHILSGKRINEVFLMTDEQRDKLLIAMAKVILSDAVGFRGNRS